MIFLMTNKCILKMMLFMDRFIFLQQLADALLAMEEEKAIWLAKERASVEAIEEKTNLYNAEIVSLSKGMSEVTFKAY